MLSRLGNKVSHDIVRQVSANEYELGHNSLTRVRIDNANRVFLIGGALTYDIQRNRWRTGNYHEYDYPKMLGTFLGIELTSCNGFTSFKEISHMIQRA
jgi:hypothetical protein